MPKANVTLEELYAGIQRPAGKMHKLIIHRIRAHFLALDVGFAHHSGVLLPVLPVEAGGTTPKKPKAPPFAVLKQVFDYAEQHPGHKLLIAGHTDTSGSAYVNQIFSETRASSVYSLLKGDRELWAKCCETRYETTDLQAMLKWAAREHGFGCDPGEVDGITGPKTLRAQQRFRQRYNDEFAGHMKIVGPMTMEDWKAFFDLYEVSLARILGVPEGKLSTKRAHLKFVAEPVLGCGEHWPMASGEIDGLKNASNRRVDFVFVEEEGFPSLQKQTPPGYELYGMPLRFKRDVIAPAIREGVTLRLVSTDELPIPEARFIARWSDGTSTEGRLERTGLKFIAGVPPGPFTVEYPDLEDLRAGALAARFHHAVQERDAETVAAVLAQPAAMVKMIDAMYSAYFNDLSGGGLTRDARRAVEGSKHQTVVDHLLCGAGLNGASETAVFAFAEPTLKDDGGTVA